MGEKLSIKHHNFENVLLRDFLSSLIEDPTVEIAKIFLNILLNWLVDKTMVAAVKADMKSE